MLDGLQYVLAAWEGAVPVSSPAMQAASAVFRSSRRTADFVAPQTRMNFKPTVEEVVEIMLEHLKTPDSDHQLRSRLRRRAFHASAD